ncbi:hypothetical protein PV327_002282 [Microctonus hyperodae]|uniref:Decapping nuclease n=1 Tax=Microctonus hyperodae TaxID=165561 RepID=A0AA39KP61_MICHY|nr:hypothetical protein PV327_002282 [Microctonus hyperodae]
MTLYLKNKLWGKNFPYVSKPKVIGYYSVDSDRQLHFDSSQLKYYCPPTNDKINFDLNDGIHTVHRKPASANDEKIDHILQWIKQKIPPLSDNKWLSADFVCLRGLLTKIMKTPYDEKEGWIICAVKFKGTIYLCAFDTDADKYEKSNRTMRDLTFMSWGFKFEQYLVSDAPGKEPNTNKPVDEAAEFCCVFETRLVNSRILYGAEMDGIKCDELLDDPLPLKELKFFELKTSRIVERPQQFISMKRFKFLKWWCQSFLVGIEDISCGFRNDKGIVCKVENYQVQNLARISSEYWSAANAMNFCDAFLQHVSKIVTRNYDECVYKFERKPFGDIIMTELPPSPEYSFLPQWYTQPDKSGHRF